MYCVLEHNKPGAVPEVCNGKAEAEARAKQIADKPGKVVSVYYMQRALKVEAIQTIDASIWLGLDAKEDNG